MRRTLALLTLTVSIILAGCGGGESKEEIASRVAREWLKTNVQELVDEVVDLVIGEVPVVSQLASGILSGQILEKLDNIAWQYSAPMRRSEDRYQVVATASAEIEIELPLIGTRVYKVSLPFNLDVDTEDESVVSWLPDVTAASVEESG